MGPGSYLAEQFEERRSGWRRKSFSNRQPMEEPKNKSISRSDYYLSGVLSPNGTMATPASPARSHSPGPGYYEGPHSVFSFPTDAHVSYISTQCCSTVVLLLVSSDLSFSSFITAQTRLKLNKLFWSEYPEPVDSAHHHGLHAALRLQQLRLHQQGCTLPERHQRSEHCRAWVLFCTAQ